MAGENGENAPTQASGSGPPSADGPRAGASSAAGPGRDLPRARVAVITRTRDRPLLLSRAARSVSAQTFQDFLWVVVNDGGARDAVRHAIAGCGIPSERLVLLDHDESRGMEAAANAGVRACQSEFIVVHDDDDTWTPAFLAETVAYLDTPQRRDFGGVVTIADRVSEEIRGESVIEHARSAYNSGLKAVEMAEMACRNLFPPISFLFKRSVFDAVGGFNERLPVLGDWYFNLRFLTHADIGVLPKPLARWHHRDRGEAAGAVYANSVIGGIDLHEEYAAVVRNALLRDLARDGAGGALPVLGYLFAQVRTELAHLRAAAGGKTNSDVALIGLEPEGREKATAHDLLAAAIDLADRRWVLHCIQRQRPFRSLIGTLTSPGRWSPAEPRWAELAKASKGCRIEAPPDFDETAYIAANPDVARESKSRRFAGGFDHYVRYGRVEGRLRPLKLAALVRR